MKFILLLPLFVLLLFGCGDNTKSPPYPGYSYSINDSKSNGVFIFEMSSNKDTLLFDSLYKCSISESWIETQFNKQVMMIGKTKIQKFDSSYQLVMQLHIDTLSLEPNNNVTYFVGSRISYNLAHYKIKSPNLDTIKVPVFKKVELKDTTEKKAFDTLIFIRKTGI